MAKNNFVQIMQLVADQNKSKKLYKKAETLYLMRSFKITNISSSEAIQSYDKLLNKYDSQELKIVSDDWHKNQRKLFIWYLICYCEQNKCSINDIPDKEWDKMSHIFFGKSSMFLKFQGLSIIKNAKRHSWSEQDDELLKKYVKQINTNQWNLISKSIFFEKGSGKFISAKQCRQRWFNHICQQINKDEWTYFQDIKILKFTLQMGKKWSAIARQLNTNRTQHMVKNRFNSIINKIRKKKLQNQQSLTKKAINMIEKQYLEKKSIEQSDQSESSQEVRQVNQMQKIIQPIPIILPAQQDKYVQKKLQRKQGQVSKYIVNQLPEGDIKDKLNIVNKAEKGCIAFVTEDNVQCEQNEGLTQGIVLSMTPNSVKAISPGFNSFFCDFSSFVSTYDKQRRDDGSSLFSPANFSINCCASPMDLFALYQKNFKQQKNTGKNQRQLKKKSSLELLMNPTQLSYEYGNIMKAQEKQQQQQQ